MSYSPALLPKGTPLGARRKGYCRYYRSLGNWQNHAGPCLAYARVQVLS